MLYSDERRPLRRTRQHRSGQQSVSSGMDGPLCRVGEAARDDYVRTRDVMRTRTKSPVIDREHLGETLRGPAGTRNALDDSPLAERRRRFLLGAGAAMAECGSIDA